MRRYETLAHLRCDKSKIRKTNNDIVRIKKMTIKTYKMERKRKIKRDKRKERIAAINETRTFILSNRMSNVRR